MVLPVRRTHHSRLLHEDQTRTCIIEGYASAIAISRRKEYNGEQTVLPVTEAYV